jgi:hypothetical protein
VLKEDKSFEKDIRIREDIKWKSRAEYLRNERTEWERGKSLRMENRQMTRLKPEAKDKAVSRVGLTLFLRLSLILAGIILIV